MGIAVLIKDGLDISDTKFTNIIAGNFSKLEFTYKNKRYLMNLIYSPNEDEDAKKVYKTIFQDDDYNTYDHIQILAYK